MVGLLMAQPCQSARSEDYVGGQISKVDRMDGCRTENVIVEEVW